MRIVALVALLVLAGVLGALTVCKPEVLGANPFLLDFVNHEYVGALIVVVTVSFVSVTQIHLEYSRIERTFGLRIFGEARREVNGGAILLTLLLLGSLPLVIVKAAYLDDLTVQSLFHSTALVILVTAVFVMYDFVRTVYVLAAEEPIEAAENDTAESDQRGEA